MAQLRLTVGDRAAGGRIHRPVLLTLALMPGFCPHDPGRRVSGFGQINLRGEKNRAGPEGPARLVGETSDRLVLLGKIRFAKIRSSLIAAQTLVTVPPLW